MDTNHAVIYLCEPQKKIRVVSIHRSQRVSILLKLFPSQDKIFVNNGEIINLNGTFKSNGIGNNDHLIVLSTTYHDQQANMWIRTSIDKEGLEEKIKFAVDPSTKVEFARLRDMRLIKAETKSAAYRRICSQYKENEATGNNTGFTLITDYEQLLKPSDVPLPVMW